MLKEKSYARGTHPDLPPPSSEVGIVGWCRRNLFPTPANTIFTILALYVLYSFVPGLIQWAFIDAVYVAENREECWKLMETPASAACWAFTSVRLNQLLYGFYPETEIWRVNLSFVLLFVAITPVLFDKVPFRKPLFIFTTLYPFIAGWLIFGWFALPPVASQDIGGLALTLIIGITGIAFSLPLGILLALGRTSNLPVIKILSVLFIEFIRGVPLIALLFIASTMLNYFMPPGTTFDLLVRVLIMVTLFASAYMAEVIRGGLQAIPKGQYEAAEAMGLRYWQMMRLIILPQALKISIPGIVNTFIGLFKDTTLLIIIGLFDILTATTAVMQDPLWRRFFIEAYLFVGVVYFIFCFALSKYSQKVEVWLSEGRRF